MASVEVRGIGVAVGDLGRYAAAGRAIGQTAYAVTNPVVYARPIVTGRFRDGRVARRAGGTWSVYNALAQVASRIGPALARALPLGPAAVMRAMHALALAVEAGAKQREAVDTGTLRRAWRTVAWWAGARGSL